MVIDTLRRIGVSVRYDVRQGRIRSNYVALMGAPLDEVETVFFSRQLEVITPEAWSRLRLDAYHEGRCPGLGESSPGRLARRAPT